MWRSLMILNNDNDDDDDQHNFTVIAEYNRLYKISSVFLKSTNYKPFSNFKHSYIFPNLTSNNSWVIDSYNHVILYSTMNSCSNL